MFFFKPVRKLLSNQEENLLMLKIYFSNLSKRLEVEILVSPTYHVYTFLVTDVFDKMWAMNIL